MSNGLSVDPSAEARADHPHPLPSGAPLLLPPPDTHFFPYVKDTDTCALKTSLVILVSSSTSSFKGL